jgi:hypothetical protein
LKSYLLVQGGFKVDIGMEIIEVLAGGIDESLAGEAYSLASGFWGRRLSKVGMFETDLINKTTYCLIFNYLLLGQCESQKLLESHSSRCFSQALNLGAVNYRAFV